MRVLDVSPGQGVSLMVFVENYLSLCGPASDGISVFLPTVTHNTNVSFTEIQAN